MTKEIDLSMLVVGIRPESAWLSLDSDHKTYGWGYDGHCPKCNSDNIRNKGSYDKCNDCGYRIDFSNFME